jgi:hypothetical protein
MKNMRMVIEGDVLTFSMDVAEEIRRQAEPWQQAAESAQKRWEESEWLLGEARALLREREEQLHAVQETHRQLEERYRDVSARLQEAERHCDDANWYLGEVQATHERCQPEAERLTRRLGETRNDLEQMRRSLEESRQRCAEEEAHRRSIEAELAAVRAHGERRRALRMPRPDVRVELHRPDGSLLFRGRSRDVSGTGFGFSSDQPIGDLPDFVQVRLYLSGIERPIEATGRLAWRWQDVMRPNSLGGCELLDMPADCLETFEQVLALPA